MTLINHLRRKNQNKELPEGLGYSGNVETDVLIIGSGFASSTLVSQLTKTRVRFLVLDVSEEMRINYSADDETIFDQDLARKTARKYGGILTWGNSVTIPSNLNFFSRGVRLGLMLRRN